MLTQDGHLQQISVSNFYRERLAIVLTLSPDARDAVA